MALPQQMFQQFLYEQAAFYFPSKTGLSTPRLLLSMVLQHRLGCSMPDDHLLVSHEHKAAVRFRRQAQKIAHLTAMQTPIWREAVQYEAGYPYRHNQR